MLHLLIGADTTQTTQKHQTLLCATNQWGQTPLHSAFDSRDVPSSKIVRMLLQTTNRHRQAHAHIDGCNNKEECEVLTAVQMKDRRGRLPLHIACEKGAQFTIIRLLVGAWPDAVRLLVYVYLFVCLFILHENLIFIIFI